ncbi:hypothetical protein [Streptomyces pseudovenezuelae]|uniref:Uncharacterized protein n=1 Tax=Streptomyces pseudovenezuelae TaxID=67350 RepID=A0ABT6M2Q2_9ACTN|nr:hypothetical protein [Streptomyces pseudovenezuelae]MDH6222832.1 hypothetical protein [Streptomyces pseudovenezuelae]
MSRRSSNWEAHRTRSGTAGRGARRRHLGAAAQRRSEPRSPEALPAPQQAIRTRVTAGAATLLIAAGGGIGVAVSAHAQSAFDAGWDWFASLLRDDPPARLTVSSVTPMDVSAGATVVYARPTRLTQQQIEHALETATGPGVVVPNAMAEKVVLTNTGSGTVYVTDIAVHKTCTRPLNGTILYAPPGGNGGGPEGVVGIGFDLDSPHPLAQKFNADSLKLSGRYFLNHDLPVVKGIPQTLLLFARTRRSYCHYSYEITLHGDGKPTTQKIPAKGRPYQITADLIADKSPRPLAAYQTAYVPGEQNITAGGAQKPSASSNNSFVKVDPKTWKPSPEYSPPARR